MIWHVNVKRFDSIKRSEAANEGTRPCLFLLSFLLNHRPNFTTRAANDDFDSSAKNSFAAETSRRIVSIRRRTRSAVAPEEVRFLEVLRLAGMVMSCLKHKQLNSLLRWSIVLDCAHHAAVVFGIVVPCGFRVSNTIWREKPPSPQGMNDESLSVIKRDWFVLRPPSLPQSLTNHEKCTPRVLCG